MAGNVGIKVRIKRDNSDGTVIDQTGKVCTVRRDDGHPDELVHVDDLESDNRWFSREICKQAGT